MTAPAQQTGSGEFAALVAVVTGGASGIGAAVAQRLHDGGARVAILDRAAVAAPSGTAAEAAETTWLELQADVSDQTSVSTAVEQVIERWGRLDVLVNNAGIGAQGTVADGTEEQWQKVLDVNLMGMVRTARAALPHLRSSPAAAIVNVSSIAATAGLPQRALYSASKGAVLALTRAMAADHVREGIRVNCVSPGTANTPWVNRLLDAADDPDAERAALQARQPHGRLVEPEEVAEAVAYLASPRAGSTSGVTLAVDGGMDALRLRPA
ncbi:SDR family NAD(P)-dependent oxidoreductase [Ruania albidiflava]|uniref:SDR family NAD(P)-dependent oxidoreductase n=1 Tax=Ruania albidiflava TaxID=366586 RepID=UPI0003B4D617|nr:SDR family oxidoreductase [Ruania albidiflava]